MSSARCTRMVLRVMAVACACAATAVLLGSPAPAATACDPATVVYSGVRPKLKATLAAGTRVDATQAVWQGDYGGYPVRVYGPDICWRGGAITGPYSNSTSWEVLHKTAAFSIEGPRFALHGVRVHNYGDGINIKDLAANWYVRRAHLSFIRDDCIENDVMHAGVVEDSLLDGCYTALSARLSSASPGFDGKGKTWTIRRSLIRLQPMPTVYKGTAPGHGKFWKWDKNGYGITLSLHDNVWRADQKPTDGDLSFPTGYLGDCSNNVMVWLGSGPFPGNLPACFTITRDKAVWDQAVAAWHAGT